MGSFNPWPCITLTLGCEIEYRVLLAADHIEVLNRVPLVPFILASPGIALRCEKKFHASTLTIVHYYDATRQAKYTLYKHDDNNAASSPGGF